MNMIRENSYQKTYAKAKDLMSKGKVSEYIRTLLRLEEARRMQNQA